MAEIASAYVTLIPSFAGGAAKIERELGGAADRAGKSAGKKAGESTRKSFTEHFGAKPLISADFVKNTAKVIAGGMLAAGAGLALFGKQAVDAASNAEQSLGGTEAIFKQYSDTVVKRSKEAAMTFGLSANEYRENANLIGALLKNQGVEMDKLAGQTDNLVGLGSDLAAQYGGSTADAVNAISAAYKGEFNSLEKYGITLKASIIQQKAMGIAGVDSAKAWNALTIAQQQAATQQATTALLMEQSKDASGAFARESGTLAGQQQRLAATFEDIKARLGEKLLPILTKVGDYVMTNIVPAIERFMDEMDRGEGNGGAFADAIGGAFESIKGGAETFGKVIGDAFQWVKDHSDELKDGWDSAVSKFKEGFQWVKDNKDTLITLGLSIASVVVTIKTIQGAIHAWKIAQLALNVALSANPIGIIITVLALLIPWLIKAYQENETFRNVVDTAVNGIAEIWRWLWNNVLQHVFKFLVEAFAWVSDAFGTMMQNLGKVPGFEWAGEAGDAMKGAAEKAREMADGIKEIPPRTTAEINVQDNASGPLKRVLDSIRSIDNYSVRMSAVHTIRDPFAQMQARVAAEFRASGGPVKAGQPYVVGEKRPELFVPDTNGTILPRVPGSSEGSEFGGTTNNYHLTVGADAFRDVNHYMRFVSELDMHARAAGV